MVGLAAPALVLLCGLPLVVAAAAWRGRARAAARPAADWERVANLPRTWRERLRLAPAILRIVLLAVVSVAAAEPYDERREPVLVAAPDDVMIVLDASGSMQAMDLAPDRFGAARRFASALIARRPRDRFGILAFGGRTALLCPLTFDRAALGAALRGATAGVDELEEGTALGAAIVRAVDRLAAARARPSGGAIVVLTDGAANDEGMAPSDAARLAAGRAIRVHAIGFGGDRPAPYPTELGTIEVRLPVQDAALERLASQTGGRYWRAMDDAALDAIVDALDAAEPPLQLSDEQTLERRWQPVLLWLGLLLLAAEWFASAGPLRRATS